MNHRRIPTPRVLSSFALLLVASAVVGGGCTATGAENVGAAQQAETLPPPNVDPTCTIGASAVRHNSAWPFHEPGACPANDEYTLNEAASECGGGGVNYFAYDCGDLPDGSHTWTTYFACCALEPVGAECTEGLQCASGSCGSGITFETRYFAPGSTAPTSASQAIDTFSQLSLSPPSPPGYGFDVLASTAGFHNRMKDPFRDTTNFGSHLRAPIVVDSDQTTPWTFRLGADYGQGGVLLVDRQVLDAFWGSIDWGGSFDPNSSLNQFFQGSIQLGVGVHYVEAYGFEDCCDRAMEIDFLAPGQTNWQPISASSPGAPGACAPTPVALGAPCNVDIECQSGTCADGVCCDTPCDGTCMACTAAKKGSGADGTCGPSASGTPDAACPFDAFDGFGTVCGNVGGCDGHGACKKRDAGFPCTPDDFDCHGSYVYLSGCDGSGSCIPDYQFVHDCAPYLCTESEPPFCSRGCGQCAQGSTCDPSTHTCH